MLQLTASKLSDGRLQMWAVAFLKLFSSWQASLPEGAWTPMIPFSPVPGAQVRSVSAGHSPDGRVQVWVGVTDRGFNMVQSTWKLSGSPDSGWFPWQNPFGPELGLGGSTPLVGQLSDGRIQLFANFGGGNNLGLLSKLVTTWKTSADPNAPWTAWQKFSPDPLPSPPPGGELVSPIAAGQLSDGRPQLWIVTGGSNVLATSWKVSADPNAEWSPWETPFDPVLLGEATFSAAAARLSDGRLQLWVITLPGREIQTTWKASTDPNSIWTAWQAFPSPGAVDDIAAAEFADGRVILWATVYSSVNSSTQVFTCQKLSSDPNAGWTGWTVFGTIS